MQSFPLLRRIGEVVEGRERGWAELMYIESQAMVGTMLQLMARKTPSLAVHDSIIVPLSERVYAMYLLVQWYCMPRDQDLLRHRDRVWDHGSL
jgi:hypothetical protein